MMKSSNSSATLLQVVEVAEMGKGDYLVILILQCAIRFWVMYGPFNIPKSGNTV